MNKRYVLLMSLCLIPGFPHVCLRADDRFDLCGPDQDQFKEDITGSESDERKNVDFVVQISKMHNGWMKQALTGAESAFQNGNYEAFRRWMSLASRFVLFLEENANELGSSPYVRNRLRLEYSLARMINGSSAKGILVMPQNVKTWLPRTKNPLFHGNEHVSRQEAFRSLLVVGAGVNAYWKHFGKLPQTLKNLIKGNVEDLNEDDLYLKGEHIKYSHEVAFWKLRIGGENREDEPLHDFMPAVDYVAGLKCPEIWFASTYSQKRKELFERGHVESSDIRCAGYLKNGVIHRGRHEGVEECAL